MSDEKDNDNEVQSEESDDESIDDEHDSEKYTQDTWDLAYICKFNIENYYTGLNKYLEDKKNKGHSVWRKIQRFGWNCKREKKEKIDGIRNEIIESKKKAN